MWLTREVARWATQLAPMQRPLGSNQQVRSCSAQTFSTGIDVRKTLTVAYCVIQAANS